MPIETGTFSLSVLATGVVGVFVGHKLTQDRNVQDRKISEFNKDALEFYKTFADEIFTLQDAIASDSQDIQGSFHIFQNRNSDVIDARKKVKIMLERHLTDKELLGFDEAWKRYSTWYDDCNSKGDKKYHTQLLLGHIKDLLKYAKPK